MSAGKRRAAAPRAQDDDDEIPQDIDAFRNALARRISILVGNGKKSWRSCAERSCKRARSCCAPQGLCSSPANRLRPIKPEHAARNLAALQRDLAEICERNDAAREDAENGP